MDDACSRFYSLGYNLNTESDINSLLLNKLTRDKICIIALAKYLPLPPVSSDIRDKFFIYQNLFFTTGTKNENKIYELSVHLSYLTLRPPDESIGSAKKEVGRDGQLIDGKFHP